MAPRPRHVVLRDVRARRERAGVRALPGHLLVPVQQLLRDGRTALRARRAGRDQPARRPRRRRLPRQRRRADARPARPDGRGVAVQGRRHHRARVPPRAAAPGAAADGHQARPLAEPPHAGVRRDAQRRGHARPARMGRLRGWPGRDRPRGRGLLLRQRAAPPPAVPHAVPAGRPAGHQRRVAGVHRPTAATGATSSGSPTAGHGSTPRGGTLRSTGPRSTVAGSSTPSTAPGRSTPGSR